MLKVDVPGPIACTTSELSTPPERNAPSGTSLTIWRCYAASRASVIPWYSLIEHLGSHDRDRKQLKRSLGRILDKIRLDYPGFPARLLPAYRGLAIEPWRLPGVSTSERLGREP